MGGRGRVVRGLLGKANMDVDTHRILLTLVTDPRGHGNEEMYNLVQLQRDCVTSINSLSQKMLRSG